MVELIPKPTEKESPWKKVLFFLSFVLVFATVSSYFILSALQKKSQSQLKALDDAVSQKNAQLNVLQEDLLVQQRRIDDFSKIVNGHVANSDFFKVLEASTHPRVYFSKISVNSKESKVSLAGQADNFITLGQQIMLFEGVPNLEELTLSQVGMSKEGTVNFALNLTFNKKIFKFKF